MHIHTSGMEPVPEIPEFRNLKKKKKSVFFFFPEKFVKIFFSHENSGRLKKIENRLPEKNIADGESRASLWKNEKISIPEKRDFIPMSCILFARLAIRSPLLAGDREIWWLVLYYYGFDCFIWRASRFCLRFW